MGDWILTPEPFVDLDIKNKIILKPLNKSFSNLGRLSSKTSNSNILKQKTPEAIPIVEAIPVSKKTKEISPKLLTKKNNRGGSRRKNKNYTKRCKNKSTLDYSISNKT